MVTYYDMFIFVTMLTAIISLILEIANFFRKK